MRWFAQNVVGMLVFMVFALVVGVLWIAVILLVGMPLTAGAWVYEKIRASWERRRLTPSQRDALRTLELRVAAGCAAARRLDPGSMLDGLIQGESVRMRNRMVSGALDEFLERSPEDLRRCRDAGVPEHIVARVWKPAAEEIGFHLATVSLAGRLRGRDTPHLA